MFEKVLRIDPKHERAIFNLGALYAARGDYPRAVPLLEKAAGTPACKPDLREPGDRALLLTLVNAYVHVDDEKKLSLFPIASKRPAPTIRARCLRSR